MKAVILAAGKSSRMWPLAQHRTKCMHEFLGKPLLQHTIGGLKDYTKEFIIVVPPDDSSIKEYFGDGKKFGINVSYAVQKTPEGTGHALLCAEALCNEDFILVNSTKMNAGRIIPPMIKKEAAIAVTKVKNPECYGVAEIADGRLVSLEEKPKNPKSSLASINVYHLPKSFFGLLRKVKQDECSLITAINQLAKKSSIHVFETDEPHCTLKYPWHILEINRMFLDGLKKSVIKGKIHKTASITGRVLIEEGSVVGENVVIRGPCYIGKNAVIRSGCVLRQYSSVSENVLLGCNTELKNAVIYSGAKTHMNYVGDSVIDEDARLGAGTITGNRRLDRKEVCSVVKGKKIRTGLTHLGAVIGRKAKTGINSSLMPGVKLGAESFVFPGAVVFNDIKDKEVLKK